MDAGGGVRQLLGIEDSRALHQRKISNQFSVVEFCLARTESCVGQSGCSQQRRDQYGKEKYL